VDRTWWAFFKDYVPGEGTYGRDKAVADARNAASGSNGGAPSSAPPAAPSAPPVGHSTPPPAPPSAPAITPATKEPSPVERAAAPLPREPAAPKASGPLADAEQVPIRGVGARIITNMESSLEVPTATSVRSVPAKLLIDNRIVINNHLARARGGKVSFTHIIGYAIVKALGGMPEMNNAFGHDENGKPVLLTSRPTSTSASPSTSPSRTAPGSSSCPAIKAAETMDFAHFWTAYEEIVKKARVGKLTVEDFQGTTISLTNPGTIGTVHSVPRLMQGQGAIIGVGALDYPAEWQGASNETSTATPSPRSSR
jgi:2-oxoglutarate decarboxylase